MRELFTDGKAPALEFCPETQRHTLDKHDDSIKIVWDEPVFTDNVNVTHISRTNVSFAKFSVLFLFVWVYERGCESIIYTLRGDNRPDAGRTYKSSTLKAACISDAWHLFGSGQPSDCVRGSRRRWLSDKVCVQDSCQRAETSQSQSSVAHLQGV